MEPNCNLLRSGNNKVGKDWKKNMFLQAAAGNRETYFGSLFKGQRSSWWARHGDRNLWLIVMLQPPSESTDGKWGTDPKTSWPASLSSARFHILKITSGQT